MREPAGISLSQQFNTLFTQKASRSLILVIIADVSSHFRKKTCLSVGPTVSYPFFRIWWWREWSPESWIEESQLSGPPSPFRNPISINDGHSMKAEKLTLDRQTDRYRLLSRFVATKNSTHKHHIFNTIRWCGEMELKKYCIVDLFPPLYIKATF